MPDAKDTLKQHAEGIIAELSDYFEVRYQMMTRVNPSLSSMHADLLWLQMEKVRDIVIGEKMFGPERWRVAQILASRDEAKRAAVMGPIDQASILNELVPEQEEGERRPGFVVVRSMKALYTSLDPSLGPVIELTDIWLWWDVLDAADRYNFKRQCKRIESLQKRDLTPELQTHYLEAMHVREERELKREEILSFEFAYLDSICRAFTARRDEEESYQRIIKMDPIGGDDSLDDLIVTLSRHITARKKLGTEDGLDDRLREYYSKVLKCDADQVTAERATAHEDLSILRLREDLRVALERGEALGPPYAYKMRQAEEMAAQVDRYRKTLPLVDSIVQATAAATKVQKAAAPQQPQAPAQPATAEEQGLMEPGGFGDAGPFMIGG